MLNYYDDTGYLIEKYLKIPRVPSTWFLFELESTNELVSFIKSDYNINKYIVLNHISYKKMNKRLMNYQGAFGLCSMNQTFKQRLLSQNDNDSNIYNDLSHVKNIPNSELLSYVHKVFNTDFGIMINDYDSNLKVQSILSNLKNQSLLSSVTTGIKSMSLFIEYHDVYMGLVTLYFTQNSLSLENNIGMNDIDRLINIYGCRIAGNIKTN